MARGLVSRWTFNEGTGTVANDTGGVGGNNATLLPASSPPTWSTNVPTPLSTGTLPPSQVTGLTVTPASATQLNLAWTANPTTENVDHYNVYRGTTAGFTVVPGTTVPTAQPTTNSFNDTGLTAGTAYYYRVAAVEVYRGSRHPINRSNWYNNCRTGTNSSHRTYSHSSKCYSIKPSMDCKSHN